MPIEFMYNSTEDQEGDGVMLRIGITGMSGSGKSYVSAVFAKYGIPSINADAVVHRLYQDKNPCTVALAATYGDQILNPDHSINRAALASIVFQSREKLNQLNRTVHPFVEEVIRLEALTAEKNGFGAILLDAPQLFEAGLEKACDYVIAVLAEEDFKLHNIMKRDGITEEYHHQQEYQ